MTEFTIPGDFALDVESRTLRGILLPFGETSAKSQTGHVANFAADDIILPRDVSVVTLNRRHNRHDPVGRATVLEKREKHVYAEFAIADTDEGDAYLAEERDTLRKLSPEVLFAADNKHARLTGAALVDTGAFASAALFAVASTEEHHEDEFTDENGVTWKRKQDTEREHDDETNTTKTQTPVVESVDEAPNADPAKDTPNEGEFAMTASIVPGGVVTPPEKKTNQSASALFAALAQKHTSGDSSALAAFQELDASSGLFAAYAPLADITATGAAATVQAQFVGEVWKKRAFTQRVIPLFGHDDLTALKIEGWQWTTPPAVGDWAGDKAAVPSNTPVLAAVTGTAERIAGAHDVDRALRDFGNEAFWASYFRAMTEDYARKADAKVFTKAVAASTTVAPGTVPTGVPAGAAAIVDGALSVIDAGYAPTFAMVSTAIYRDLLLTKKDQTLEFLNMALGLEEGQLDTFKFIPHSGLTAKRVIVGAKEAGTVYELPGAPVRVEGIDVAHGGIDPALFGYVGWITNDAKALASVTTA